MRAFRTAFLFFLLQFTLLSTAQEQRFADIGDLKLQSGEILRNCRVGYRTIGTLNADRSNVLVMPTWAGGTTDELKGSVGPGWMADSSKYYIILVDALSNGVSSSPSNSGEQPHMQFPKITIGDMVNSQFELLTRKLDIHHVRIVMGSSMGGMQTFEWMVSHPDFMNFAIPIQGSPRLATYDLLHWQAQIGAIKIDPMWNGGDYTQQPARAANYEFAEILLTSPEHVNETIPRDEILKKIAAEAAGTGGQDANNKIRQTEAMMAQDISARFGGSMEKAAAAVKAKVLIVVGRQDHVVTPQPAMDFGKLLGATVVVLEGNCGHLAGSCEASKVTRSVTDFLNSISTQAK
jgi:homoserine O-acetyltransferase